jgi:hypothetical protein
LIAEDAGRIQRFEMGKKISGAWSSGGAWCDFNSEYWVHGSNLNGSAGSCGVNCTNDNEIYSFHPGGAEILLGDGSVRLLLQTVAPQPLAALISRSGGEVIQDGAF